MGSGRRGQIKRVDSHRRASTAVDGRRRTSTSVDDRRATDVDALGVNGLLDLAEVDLTDRLCVGEAMKTGGGRGSTLPRPDRLHHVVEDFLTTWTAPVSHVTPLRRFLGAVLRRDVRSYFADSCLAAALTHDQLPGSCRQHFVRGHGLQRPPLAHVAAAGKAT